MTSYHERASNLPRRSASLPVNHKDNAEGVNYFQPRVARASAPPWVGSRVFNATLKGLPRIRERDECELTHSFSWRPRWCPSKLQNRNIWTIGLGNPFRVAASS